MPVTRADLSLARRALNGLSQRARADLTAFWGGLDLTDARAVREALLPLWPALVGDYGDMSATLAADLFEMQAELLGIDPRTVMVRPVDAERAAARASWALTTVNQLGNLEVLLDELVKQPYRSTFARSAEESGAGWARVPSGGKTCSFCLMLSSRGATYRSAARAGRGRKFHGDCDCGVVLVRDERDYPQGYDPGALYQKYLDARDAAGSGATSKVLAELRKAEDIH